jgi:NADH:ubiquinone oxidoreductase subunit 5 (subunit L)/multisubunit Na+/H+ antiporter MnhA subunit
VVRAIAITSIVLATVAAWIQDDIEHIVGYAIAGDAGVVMLAVAALEPEAWAPARTWILAFVVARSAFAAWAAATRTVFGTGRVGELRGWAIRSPVLAIVFAVVVLASIGIPGLAVFDARTAIVGWALDPPLEFLVLLATFGPLAYYGRLLFVGLSKPDAGRAGSTVASVRPVISPLDLTELRAWLARTWSDNRIASAVAGTAVLAVLALAVSAGSFGVRDAAAGLPPTIEGVQESFVPGGPEEPADTDAPEVPASSPPVEGEPSAEPSVAPSVEPSVAPAPST